MEWMTLPHSKSDEGQGGGVISISNELGGGNGLEKAATTVYLLIANRTQMDYYCFWATS